MKDDDNELWVCYNKCKDPVLKEKIRNKIIVRYLPTVKFAVARMSTTPPPGLDFDDLFSFGIFGLIDAIDRFDISRGYVFQTFAVPRIRGAVLDEIRRYDWISRSGRDKLHKLEQTLSELPPQANDDTVREAMGLSEKAYKELLEVASRTYMVSLDEVIEVDGAEVNRGETLEGDEISPVELLERKEDVATVAGVLDTLPEREKMIISLYYYEGLTIKEIAAVMGVTESRISQLHGRALALMRGKLSS